jgi:transposase
MPLQASSLRDYTMWTAPRHRVPELGCEPPNPEPSVTQYKRIAIDTSKAVFTLHGIDQQDRPVLRINLRRAQVTPFFAKRSTTEIAMEACGGAHYWARELTALGHKIRLIPPASIRQTLRQTRQERSQ